MRKPRKLSVFAYFEWFVVDSVLHNLSCHPEIRGQILSESFFHPGTAPGAAGQVVIDNCRSTERHARGSPKERAGRREKRAYPNDCQEIILSRKNGASRKHHKIKQLQQIITAVRHQGKTKTVNISRFIFITFFAVFWAIWFNASCLEKFKMAFQTERQFGKRAIQVLCFVAK
jgi:hypothetical protein